MRLIGLFLLQICTGSDIVTVSGESSVCPNGREKNGPCKPPWVAMLRCSPGFTCVNGICCKSTNLSETPVTPFPVPDCLEGEVRTGSCSKADQRCPAKSSCSSTGSCCKPTKTRCPTGIADDGPCLPPMTAAPQCKTGFMCVNGRCCKTLMVPESPKSSGPVPDCDKGEVRTGGCSKANQQCPSGSSCKNTGSCCKPIEKSLPTCPSAMPALDPSRCPPHVNVCQKDRDCGQQGRCCTGPCGERSCISG
ncbi:uncharacterized protein K04H4.2-like [Dreissena polymorpha]|uniref:WAP domain-containing protein n=1 Tax=Dreissena polymorpha TaxID=45954 RepID=A0A9D4LB33_DREPO|nr:uncharacterized protein K04H4.2-like [Dreissena polymorpha]KAH3855203.1 hypothetical protein DPMN_097767 [Dreissena polymorpha]